MRGGGVLAVWRELERGRAPFIGVGEEWSRWEREKRMAVALMVIKAITTRYGSD
jgi:hypothetical protein